MLEIALYIKNKIKKCPLYSDPLIRISRGEAMDNKPRLKHMGQEHGSL